MKLNLFYQSDTIKMCHSWIVAQHDAGWCPVTRPAWPGCRDAISLCLYQHGYNVDKGHWEYRSLNDDLKEVVFYETDSPLSRWLYVDTYITQGLPLPPRPALGCAVIFGDKIALYPSDEPVTEPVWVLSPAIRSGHPDIFLRTLIQEKRDIGIVPYRLFIAENPNYPYEIVRGDRLDTRVPEAENRECSAALVGYALTMDNEVVYLHLVGPQASVKSIAATVVQGKSLTLTTPLYITASGLREDREYRVFLHPVPQTRQYRAIVVARAAMPDGVPAGQRAFFVSPRPNDFTALARRLNTLLPIPIREEWGESIYKEANDTLIRGLRIGGDVQMGVAISTDVDRWIGLTSRLLEGVLEI